MRFINLVKLPIALLSVISAVTGFILAGGDSYRIAGLMIAGVFLLAAGAAALNQYQERVQDAMMKRTCDRPLPSGRMTPLTALCTAVVLLAFGQFVLIFGVGELPALLGAVTVVFYNGIYTYLKRVTAFAAVPGALVGALIPAIGWTAGAAPLFSGRILLLMVFIFVWQIPHFWLYYLGHADDYRRAGVRKLADFWETPQIRRVSFSWILATVCISMFFPLYGMLQHKATFFLLVAMAVTVTAIAAMLLKPGNLRKRTAGVVFYSVNIFFLCSMVLLIIDYRILAEGQL